MILPGRATLTVQSRPLLGWNIAVGFEVSTTAGLFAVTSRVPFDIGLASDLRFRFCNCSISNEYNMYMIRICYHGVCFASPHFVRVAFESVSRIKSHLKKISGGQPLFWQNPGTLVGPVDAGPGPHRPVGSRARPGQGWGRTRSSPTSSSIFNPTSTSTFLLQHTSTTLCLPL